MCNTFWDLEEEDSSTGFVDMPNLALRQISYHEWTNFHFSLYNTFSHSLTHTPSLLFLGMFFFNCSLTCRQLPAGGRQDVQDSRHMGEEPTNQIWLWLLVPATPQRHGQQWVGKSQQVLAQLQPRPCGRRWVAVAMQPTVVLKLMCCVAACYCGSPRSH